MKKTIIAIVLTAWAIQAGAQTLPYQNPNLTAEQRAEDLLKRLTLEEKTKLMMDRSPAIPRLGIPRFEWWNEALHGVGRNGTATVYPITMCMAASWDEALLEQVFSSVSDEARVKTQQAKRSGDMKRYQCLSFWTPNINIFRDPRWGRGQETYGEDPYLTGVMGSAVVRGLQGPADAKYRKLLACAKHFAVHSGPEWNRHSFNIENLPPRDLWETYLPAFKALVQDAKVAEVMCAYQRIDGQPCCGNTRYEQQILRDEWGFKGLIVSDCGAISDFWQKGRHGVSEDAASASAKAVRSGTDLECGSEYKRLPDAVKAGKVSEADLDVSLKRLLKARFELGDFDADELVEWTKIPESIVACDAHKHQALDMARKGTVLLQNKDGILPLRADGAADDIVVMGPNATDSVMMWGNYNGFPPHTVTMLQGIRHKAGNVKYIQGCGLTRSEVDVNRNGMTSKSTPTREELLAEIGSAETVVFVGGISPRLEGEEMKVDEPGFRGGDRLSIELPQVQRDMMAMLHEAGKKVIFVCCSGSALGLVPESINCDAIIQAWYGGEQGGRAVADIIFGDYNPSGKLPVTFYKNADQLPDFEDYRMEGRTYRYFRGEPLFPFGHGLSYTTFGHANMKYDAKKGVLTLDVTNTGKRDGDDVVQVYIRNTADTDGPIKSLRAYSRVSLKAGERRTVSIALPRERFEGWDAKTNTMRVVPGKYEIMAGSSSAADALKTITVKVK